MFTAPKAILPWDQISTLLLSTSELQFPQTAATLVIGTLLIFPLSEPQFALL